VCVCSTFVQTTVFFCDAMAFLKNQSLARLLFIVSVASRQFAFAKSCSLSMDRSAILQPVCYILLLFCTVTDTERSRACRPSMITPTVELDRLSCLKSLCCNLSCVREMCIMLVICVQLHILGCIVCNRCRLRVVKEVVVCDCPRPVGISFSIRFSAVRPSSV